MGIVILIGLIALGVNLAVGYGLAAVFFKNGSGRMTGGIVLTLLSMGVCAAIVWAACGNVLR